jgi:predicted GH43/DUF377 family glycosyl hydrolase
LARLRPLFRKVFLAPDDREYSCTGAFNPACGREGGCIHVLFRASDSGFNSSLGYARLDLEHTVMDRSPAPVLRPSTAYDRFGVEDPKLIRWRDGWLVLYHAVGTDGHYVGVSTAAAYGRDFRSLVKLGVVRPFVPLTDVGAAATEPVRSKIDQIRVEYRARQDLQTLWGKDVVLFPEPFGAQHLAVYRLPPVIAIAPLPSLCAADGFWRAECLDPHRFLLQPRYQFEARSISPSAPPILTDHGWLLVFHCVGSDAAGNTRYTASVALLDRDRPACVLGRLTDPLLEPEQDWELFGTVDGTVYVSSVDVRDGLLLVYYGAGDVRSAVAGFDLTAVIAALR